LAACQTAPPPPAPAPAPASAAVATPQPAPRVVDVTAVDYAFRAPEAIPAGWTTIRFRNDGEEHHMVFMSRLPEGRTVEEYERELSAPFARAWNAIQEGRADQEEALSMIFQAMPEWFPKVEFVGGPGIVAPGVTSEVTMNLEPGNYVLECYIKTPDGEIHYMEGMIRPLTVSERHSDVPTPSSDIRVTLSNFDMAVEGNLTPGRRTVAVHVAENPEQGFGHSVHVARLDPGTDVQEVVEWMNWFALDGLRTPAPAHFVGGMHPMPARQTAYFTVNLERGRYLFVSEATGAQGVRKEVTVR
ncbi:MAG: hypothetical protein M3157_07820, partial [Actinomycetota bacterium]|nr:hypothetical protein [Actinomycetota bacterium]